MLHFPHSTNHSNNFGLKQLHKNIITEVHIHEFVCIAMHFLDSNLLQRYNSISTT